MKRSEFLSSKWQPYPQAPSHHNLKGRFDRLGLKVPAAWSEILRPGDWVSAHVENGEVREVLLLAPDLSGSPDKTQMPWKAHQEFQSFLHLVRKFFVNRQFFEVHTPTLVVSPGTEPYLDVFSTEFSLGKHRRKFFLPTSPELHLKKVMAEQGQNIFEMRPCFRNGELSSHHQPEFWMLEFYRAFEDLGAIQKDVEALVLFLAQEMNVPGPSKVLSQSMSSLFFEKLKFELRPGTTREELLRLAKTEKIQVNSEDSWDDIFFHIFVDRVEPTIAREPLFFLNKYPPSQAALARLTGEGWGDRFEVYWHGLELGNAFHELNDPQIQRQRFHEDLAKKQELAKTPIPIDEDFLQALEAGMPPSSGIAIGLERLFMSLKGHQNLADFRLFPLRD